MRSGVTPVVKHVVMLMRCCHVVTCCDTCAQGCPFDIRVCIYAAEAGQLAALRYAVEAAGQTVNTAVLYAAAAKDNLACLTYMVKDLVRLCSHASAVQALFCTEYF